MKKIIKSFTSVYLIFIVACESPKELLPPEDAKTTNGSQNLRIGNEKLLIDESITSDYMIKNGIICFKDLDTYTRLMKNNDGFIEEFKLKNPDFISFKKMAQNAINNAESSDTYEKMKNIIKKNSELIYEKDKIVYETMPGFTSEIINPSGLVAIGKVYYRFTPEFQYIIFGDTKELLENVKLDKFDGKTIVRIKKTNDRRNAKPSVYGCTWLGGYRVNDSNNRRVETHLWADAEQYYVGNDPVTGVAYIRINLWVENVGNSFKKAGLWGNWTSYKTNHTLYSNYEVKASLNNVQKIQQTVNLLKTSNDVEQIRYSKYITEDVLSTYPVNSFTRSVYWLSTGKHFTTDVVSPGAYYDTCYGNAN